MSYIDSLADEMMKFMNKNMNKMSVSAFGTFARTHTHYECCWCYFLFLSFKMSNVLLNLLSRPEKKQLRHTKRETIRYGIRL